MTYAAVGVGDTIADRYVVLARVGAGGMGVVLRARDEKLGREVAVKVLPAGVVGDDAARRRLVREARAAAGLEHPAIVRVYDVGETGDGGAFVVMELVKGKSLREHLEAGTLDRAERARVVVEAARAIAFAHDKGFVHRDIKPDNVMVRDDGRPVVLDFGLARAVDADAHGATVTAEGTFVGTPAYMAPEQARGERVGPGADQFALAVTAFEALSGALPWKARTALEMVALVLHAPPARLEDVAPELPRALGDVLARAMQKPEGERFPDVAAFADALAKAAELVADSGGGGAPASARGLASSDSMAHAATLAATPSAASLASTKAAGTVSGSIVARPAAPAPSARRYWPFAAAAIAVGAAYGLARYGAAPHPTAPPPPLLDRGTLACPALAAAVPDMKTTGWLGAAAAHLACERARLRLGGSASRTQVPAELLDLPHTPGEGFPADMYEDASAREKMIARAKSAEAWIDGSVRALMPAGFEVELALVDREGRTRASGKGSASTLVAAVRAAMTGPIEDALPADDRFARRAYAGASIGAALALHDLHVTIVNEDSEGTAEECKRVLARDDLAGMSGFAHTTCADKTFVPPPPPALDRSSPLALLTSAASLRAYTADGRAPPKLIRDAATELDTAASSEADPDVRAVLAAGAAELHYTHGDGARARASALVSVEASPEEVDPRGTAWHRLGFTTPDASAAFVAAMQGWAPWDPFGQANLGRVLMGPTAEIEHAWRASILAQHGYWSNAYGDTLLRNGKVDQAETVAARTHSRAMMVDILVRRKQLGAARREATDALRSIEARTENAGEAIRLARSLAEVSVMLGQPVEVDDLVTRFVDPDPPRLSRGVVPFFGLVGTCLLAPKGVGSRCLERVRALFDAGFYGAAFTGARDMLDGALRWQGGDLAGCAKAWRPLVDSALVVDYVRTPVATALDRLGEPDLAERVDAPLVADAERGKTMNLAVVRSALRAEKRGDKATARKLAQEVIDAWDATDERPPSVDTMRKLLARVK